MTLLKRLSLRVRLLLLASVPVIGALVLAVLIAQDARHRAESAASLGSVEDLAGLSEHMNALLFAIQAERAQAALEEGQPSNSPALVALFRLTDERREELEARLAGRDRSKLTPRLRRELDAARTELASLTTFRSRLANNAASIDDILDFYGSLDDALLDATSALSELSDDGEFIRNIAALVAISELAERMSAEQAVLANAGVHRRFAPGLFKRFIALDTEQNIYEDAFRANAADELVRRLNDEEHTRDARTALALREKWLKSADDVVDLDAQVWFGAQGRRVALLEDIAHIASDNLAAEAHRKVTATRESIRFSIFLSIAVISISTLLAWTILRGITRSVDALSSAAARVQETKDFSVRARKTSTDELGRLTDTFNDMLQGVQSRDSALMKHRANLETIVRSRTEELANRNQSMRFVLDNVEQGLAMLRVDGTIHGERSARFDALLGVPDAKTTFAELIDPLHTDLYDALVLGWEVVCEGILPLDVTIEQLPKTVFREGRHLTLDFRPVVEDGAFAGALLVVTDVTSEIEARLEQEKQREYVAIFERAARDHDGFVAFLNETSELFARLAAARDDVPATMRLVHTIKGNAGQWGVSSIAHLAHEIESEIVDTGALPTCARWTALAAAWRATSERVTNLLGGAESRIELTRPEIDELLREVRAGVRHEVLADSIERFYAEPVSTRFQRIDLDLERLAKRLGKAKPELHIEANGVRLPAERFGSFWASLVHVVRNMMDHGIEAPEARIRAGKPEAGRILLRASEAGNLIAIECADDGAGVDWERVAEKAKAAGLPCATPADLEAALFANGMSTVDEVTEISGRGIGLPAVLERVTALGGRLRIVSSRGLGTRCIFTFPRNSGEVLQPSFPKKSSRDSQRQRAAQRIWV